MKNSLSVNDVRDTTMLIVHLTKKLSESGIYPVSIPVGSSAKSLLAAGHFNLAVGPDLIRGVDCAIAPLVFVKLFSLPKEIIEQVNDDSLRGDFVNQIILPFCKSRRGYRQASVLELLALGAQYPDFQKTGPIVAMGDGFRWSDDNYGEPIKYPRLAIIKHHDRVSRVFDWFTCCRLEELSSLRFAMVVK